MAFCGKESFSMPAALRLCIWLCPLLLLGKWWLPLTRESRQSHNVVGEWSHNRTTILSGSDHSHNHSEDSHTQKHKDSDYDNSDNESECYDRTARSDDDSASGCELDEHFDSHQHNESDYDSSGN